MKTLVFDCETTGLLANSLLPLDRQPRIIELSSLILEEEKEEAFSQLFNPGFTLEKIITSITGLTDADLSAAPAFAERAKEIKTLIESADEVVAHNLSFDKAMIDNEMNRAGLAVKWPLLICSVEASEWYFGFRLNLTKLHEHLFSEVFADAHRAGADVKALARCFREMRNRGDI